MKTEFKGTPGPWHLSIPTYKGKWAGFNTQQGNCYGVYATNDDLEAICLVPKDELLAHSIQDNEANAHLIAAAPELLYACQSIMEAYEDKGHLLNFNVNIVRQAIDKALNSKLNQ